MKAHYEIHESKNGEMRFQLKDLKGMVILSSAVYTSRANCGKGIESCREHSPFDRFYSRSETGEHSFSLRSSNNRIIGHGGKQATANTRDAMISAVKKYAPTAQIVNYSEEGEQECKAT